MKTCKSNGQLSFEVGMKIQVRHWKEHYIWKLTGKLKNRHLKGTLQIEIKRKLKIEEQMDHSQLKLRGELNFENSRNGIILNLN